MEDLENILASMIGPEELQKVQTVVSAMTSGTPKGPSAVALSKLWLISEPLAEKALEQNTQLSRHSADNLMSRKFTTNDRMLRYRSLQSAFF